MHSQALARFLTVFFLPHLRGRTRAILLWRIHMLAKSKN